MSDALSPPVPAPEARRVVMLCCAIKPLCAWNGNETATTCRERCGGQGYLSVNRFGQLIGCGRPPAFFSWTRAQALRPDPSRRRAPPQLHCGRRFRGALKPCSPEERCTL